MQPDYDFPYPTFIEVLRAFTRALDIKYSKKILDDKAFDRHFDPRLTDTLIEDCLTTPLIKYVGSQASELISGTFKRMIQEYSKLIAEVAADGITRQEMIPLLLKWFYKDRIAQSLAEIFSATGGPSPVTLFGSDDNAVEVVLNWISNNETGWKAYHSSLTKDQRDRLSAWSRGELPSSQYIILMSDWSAGSSSDKVNWDRAKLLLLIARAIESVRRQENQQNLIDAVRLSLWGAEEKGDLASAVLQLQNKANNQHAAIIPYIAEIEHRLRRTSTKQPEERTRVKQCLDFSKAQLKAIPSGFTTTYWLDWYEARWYMLSGDLMKANELYQQAFNDCLFRSGENQRLIIEEALVVAASLKRPDKVFLKHLKWASLKFGYDLPSVKGFQPSNKFSATIEDWEIDLWKSNLLRAFPKHGFFPGFSVEKNMPRIGPWLCADPDAIKPDYNRPDRERKIGDTWKKTLPQLVWFTVQENVPVVEKLLDKEATVNCASDVGDTPILMALESLNVTELPPRSLDERCFNLISQHPHASDTINKRTQKKRLLPIISAVLSGRPDVVEKVLELGADPNGRGETDEQTPLNLCLKYIGVVKDPEKYLEIQRTMPITPEVLDSIRRYSGGLSGFTLEQQKLLLAENRQNEFFSAFADTYRQNRTNQITKHMSLANLRSIAKKLIENGADVNAEHSSPQKGYTPLMLAAEWDEKELFEIMVHNGGDPRKQYYNSLLNKAVDCYFVADFFKSAEVKALLVKHT